MNEPLKTRIAIIDKLRDIRKRKNLSYRNIETLTGIDNSSVSKIEKEYKNITLDTVIMLAAAVGYKVELAPIDEDEP